MKKHPKADCENCPLQFSGRFVPTKNPTAASNGIVIIGEAPGSYEAEQGEPFVGPSGKLLNSVLQHNGIKREETTLTNAVACRPPNNDTPDEQALSACRPRLLYDIQQSRTESNSSNNSKALLLGNSACKSLLGRNGINAIRVGSGLTSKYLPEHRVVASLHPAAVLRAPDTINLLTTDIGKLNSEPTKWKAPSYFVAEDAKTGYEVLEQLRARGNVVKIAVDIESNIEKDVDFGQPNQQQLLCVGVAYDSKKVVVFGEEAVSDKEFVRELGRFINSIDNVVYQNGKFDQKGLYPLAGHVKMTSDTMLMSYCLWEYSGIHSLEFLGRELLGAPDWKHSLDKYSPKKNGYGVIPKPILYQYNAYDCDITWEVESILRQRCDKLDLIRVHDFLVEASQELMYVEMNGIGVDRNHLAVLGKDFQEQLEHMREKLEIMLPVTEENDDSWGHRNYLPESARKKSTAFYNPGSPQQTKSVLKDFGAIVESTDEPTLKFIIEKKPNTELANFCEELLKYRGVAKQKGTYVDGIEKRLYAGRIYTNFLLHGTTNGRLSSRNPNLQNIPRRKIIRKLFVPVKPSNIFIQADYSQAELRVLAWLAGDKYFTDIFNEGKRDIFNELSENVLFPQYPKSTTDAEFFKDLRVRVKAYVYGLGYGRTEHGISNELGISLDEARVGMQRFFSVIPEIVEWQKWVKNEVNSGRDLVSAFGRRRRFPLITRDNHDEVMREALSFLPSSISSDVCLRAMCRVRRDTRGIGFVRNIVHDSILIECDERRVEEVKAILTGRMLESGNELVGDFVKFKVDVEIGESWGF